MLDVISTVLIYYGFLYWNAPYAVSEKFVNLFNMHKKNKKLSRAEIRHFCLTTEKKTMTAWQMVLRILAMPGVFIGIALNFLSIGIPKLIALAGDFCLNAIDHPLPIRILGGILIAISKPILILASPILISLALFGINVGYDALCQQLFSPLECISNFLPPDTFLPFAYIQGFFNSLMAGQLNLLVGLLGILGWLVLSAFYFATIYGIMEITTVPLWKTAKDEDGTTNTESKNVFIKCLDSIKEFFKNTRIPYKCRMDSNDEHCKLSDYIYNKMCVPYFVATCITVAIFLFIWVPATNSALPFATNIINFIFATGVPQILVSFIVTALMGLCTHKLYNKLPESVREVIEEKLTDAIQTIAKNIVNNESIAFNFSTSSTSASAPQSNQQPQQSQNNSDHTNIFGNRNN